MTAFHPPITPLFVPATHPDRFGKAAKSGADAVIIDLEDAVARQDKATARTNITASSIDLPAPVFIRVNADGSDFFDDDISHLASLGDKYLGITSIIAGIVLPKIERPDTLATLAQRLGDACPIIGFVETALGVVNLGALCRAGNLVQFGFGAIDYALDVGCQETREALLHARCQIVTASRAFGKHPPLDAVTANFTDGTLVADDAKYAASLGFGGKLLIHPKQVAPAKAAFAPTPEDIAWAGRVLEVVAKNASKDSGKDSGKNISGAMQLDGTMIDRPVIEKAKRILASRPEA